MTAEHISIDQPCEKGTHDTKQDLLRQPLLENTIVPAASSLQVGVNLVTCLLGVGIFSLPWSTAGASIIPSIVIVIGVMWINAWTCTLIVEAGAKYKTYDLGSILAHLPQGIGHRAQAICNVGIWLSLFLSLVAYFTVMVDAIMPFVEDTHFSSRPRLVSVFCLVVLPLCMLDQRYLSFTSFLAVGVTLYIFCVIAAHLLPSSSDNAARPSACVLGFGTGNIAMFSAMMQAVAIQVCVLPMYEELQSRSPKKFRKITAVSFSCTCVFFIAFAIFGYLVFGPSVSSNIIQDLPTTSASTLARVSSAACVIAIFPIMAQAMASPVRVAKGPVQARRATVSYVILAALGAMVFPDLCTLNVLNGALSCGAFVAVCPSLIGIYLLDGRSRAWTASMFTLLLFGLLAAGLGLYFTDNNALELMNSCLWEL